MLQRKGQKVINILIFFVSCQEVKLLIMKIEGGKQGKREIYEEEQERKKEEEVGCIGVQKGRQRRFRQDGLGVIGKILKLYLEGIKKKKRLRGYNIFFDKYVEISVLSLFDSFVLW